MSRSIVLSMLAALLAVAMFGSGGTGEVARVNAAPVIGENSCIGANACSILGPNAVIGDNSCNGEFACSIMDGVIGDNSCNAKYACSIVDDDAVVGDRSCGGGQFACSIVNLTGTVGDDSCYGEFACSIVNGVVGNLSCYGTFACSIVSIGGVVGNMSCYGYNYACSSISETTGDCYENPGCLIEVEKLANPETIPSSGGTTVNYRIRIDIIEEVVVNWISDDSFMLDVDEACEVFGENGASQGPPDLPDVFDAGSSIICDYSYAPPPGPVGSTHDNVATVNVGWECSVVPVGAAIDASTVQDQVFALLQAASIDVPDLGVAASICTGSTSDVAVNAILPGEVLGTVDVTAEASVRYVARDDRRPPNIGAGLSGLFNGMPTPLPTAPSAVAPATSPVIRPPSTGDAGLVDGEGPSGLGIAAGLTTIAAVTLAFSLRRIVLR